MQKVGTTLLILAFIFGFKYIAAIAILGLLLFLYISFTILF